MAFRACDGVAARRILAIRGARPAGDLGQAFAASTFITCIVVFFVWASDPTGGGTSAARWISAALLVVWTVFWFPLFPRVVAVLAGMNAGPAALAVIGHVIATPLLSEPWVDEVIGEAWYPGVIIFTVPLLAISLGNALLNGSKQSIWWLIASPLYVGLVFVPFYGWIIMIMLWLRQLMTMRLRASPTRCAIVSAVLAIGMAIFGTVVGQAWVWTDEG